MPFRICKSFEIESGHMLSKHAGKCRFPHGHSRRIEVVLVAEHLNAADMVCDFKALKEALESFLERWDHALCLNTADPEFAHFEKTYQPRVIPFTNADPLRQPPFASSASFAGSFRQRRRCKHAIRPRSADARADPPP